VATTIVLKPGDSLDLPPQKHGDTWFGFDIEFSETDIDLTGATIEMGFKIGSSVGKLGPELLTTSNNSLEVLSPTRFRANKKILDLKAGLWAFDIQFTLAAGTYAGARLTFFPGTIEIIQDVTPP
jgi:hypothetical protein